MAGEILPPAALPGLVVTGVGVASIAMAAVALLLGLKRRESGYDPMLVISAAGVILLALVILVTR